MKHVLFTRPRRLVRHACGRLGIDILEDRLCPSGYVITDLGQVGGNASSTEGINSSGQVAGTVHNFNPVFRFGTNYAFLYSDGSRQTIVNSFGGQFSGGEGINNNGDVVGGAEITKENQSGGADSHAFLYQHNTGSLLWAGKSSTADRRGGSIGFIIDSVPQMAFVWERSA